MYNFSIRASSRYYECSAFESVRYCVRGDIHSEFITDGRFCVLCTLEFTSFPYCCNKCNYDHRLLFVLTLRFAFIFIASAASIFGDDIIACNQILNSLSTDDATLRQWHSDPVNLMDNAIKWAIDGKYDRKKTIQSEFKSTIFFMWPSHTHTQYPELSVHFNGLHVILWQWWMQIHRLVPKIITRIIIKWISTER